MTYGVRGGEEVHVEADGPDGGAVLHGEGDDDGLQGADEADEGGEGERRRVLLQGVRLEDEEGGPGEGGDDDEERAQEPLPAAGVDGGGDGSGRLGAVALRVAVAAGPRHLHQRALVQRHHHRAGHGHQRPGHLRLAPHLLQVHLLHPEHARNKVRGAQLLCFASIAFLIDRSIRRCTNTIPKNHGHHEGHGWKDVAHGARESRPGELETGVVEVLVYHRPVM